MIALRLYARWPTTAVPANIYCMVNPLGSELYRDVADAIVSVDNRSVHDVAQAVLDMEWLQRLNSLMELGRKLVLAVGGLLPLLLKRMKMDPALVSSPLLTTVTDMCGFFLVLSLASAWLPHLVT